ncbi:MAG TPA: hypothetical protein ENH28_04135 [Euryarchaeota archaeon]|nr:hypothetical protein [Euryarchaeota archaeon]
MALRLIVTSRKDMAGRNIFTALSKLGFKEEGSFEGMPVLRKGDITAISTERGQVEAEHLDEYFSPEYYVFATRHRSESGIKTLTVHAPGNLTSEARIGGKPEELAITHPCAMKVALLELRRQRDLLGLDYRVSLEATHHGPTSLKKPVLFVEVGSTEKEWNHTEAVEAVATAAVRAAENREDFPACLGAGGNHYAPRHTELVFNTSYAMGHIIPGYAIDALKFEVFRQAVKKSRAEFVYLDWKGMKKEERKKILDYCSRLSLPVKKGRLMSGGDGRELDIDLKLFSEAEKVGGRLIKKLKKKLDVERDETGDAKKVFSGEISEKELMQAALEDLKRRYVVEVEGEELLLGSSVLSPEKAKVLGVKPGPDFSILAGGKSIDVYGKTITPEMVTSNRVKRIRVSWKWLTWLRQNV